MAVPGKKQCSPEAFEFAISVVESSGILNDELADELALAFAAIPRSDFVAAEFMEKAFFDEAVPAGYGQVIERPTLLARMIGLLGLEKGMRVLEVGSGSGYSSAIMASLGVQVYALEKVGLLAQQARKRLDSMGFQNVLIRTGDGARGWKEHAPFDAILVNTVLENSWMELVEQLTEPDGSLLTFSEESDGTHLFLVEKDEAGIQAHLLEVV